MAASLYSAYVQLHEAFTNKSQRSFVDAKKTIERHDKGVLFHFTDNMDAHVAPTTVEKVRLPQSFFNDHGHLLGDLYMHTGGDTYELRDPNDVQEARAVFGKMLFDYVRAAPAVAPIPVIPEPMPFVSKMRERKEWANTRDEDTFIKIDNGTATFRVGNAPLRGPAEFIKFNASEDTAKLRENSFAKLGDIDVRLQQFILRDQEDVLNKQVEKLKAALENVYGKNSEKMDRFVRTFNAEVQRAQAVCEMLYKLYEPRLRTSYDADDLYKSAKFAWFEAIRLIDREFDLDGILNNMGIPKSVRKVDPRDEYEVAAMLKVISVITNKTPEVTASLLNAFDQIKDKTLGKTPKEREKVYDSHIEKLKHNIPEYVAHQKKVHATQHPSARDREFDSGFIDYILDEPKYANMIIEHAPHILAVLEHTYKDYPELLEDIREAFKQMAGNVKMNAEVFSFGNVIVKTIILIVTILLAVMATFHVPNTVNLDSYVPLVKEPKTFQKGEEGELSWPSLSGFWKSFETRQWRSFPKEKVIKNLEQVPVAQFFAIEETVKMQKEIVAQMNSLHIDEYGTLKITADANSLEGFNLCTSFIMSEQSFGTPVVSVKELRKIIKNAEKCANTDIKNFIDNLEEMADVPPKEKAKIQEELSQHLAEKCLQKVGFPKGRKTPIMLPSESISKYLSLSIERSYPESFYTCEHGVDSIRCLSPAYAGQLNISAGYGTLEDIQKFIQSQKGTPRLNVPWLFNFRPFDVSRIFPFAATKSDAPIDKELIIAMGITDMVLEGEYPPMRSSSSALGGLFSSMYKSVLNTVNFPVRSVQLLYNQFTNSNLFATAFRDSFSWQWLVNTLDPSRIMKLFGMGELGGLGVDVVFKNAIAYAGALLVMFPMMSAVFTPGQFFLVSLGYLLFGQFVTGLLGIITIIDLPFSPPVDPYEPKERDTMLQQLKGHSMNYIMKISNAYMSKITKRRGRFVVSSLFKGVKFVACTISLVGGMAQFTANMFLQGLRFGFSELSSLFLNMAGMSFAMFGPAFLYRAGKVTGKCMHASATNVTENPFFKAIALVLEKFIAVTARSLAVSGSSGEIVETPLWKIYDPATSYFQFFIDCYIRLVDPSRLGADISNWSGRTNILVNPYIFNPRSVLVDFFLSMAQVEGYESIFWKEIMREPPQMKDLLHNGRFTAQAKSSFKGFAASGLFTLGFVAVFNLWNTSPFDLILINPLMTAETATLMVHLPEGFFDFIYSHSK